jgi:hypothetical protein
MTQGCVLVVPDNRAAVVNTLSFGQSGAGTIYRRADVQLCLFFPI